MDKQTARRRQAARDARARAGNPGASGQDDQVGQLGDAAMQPFEDGTPTDMLAEMAENDGDLDPFASDEQAERERAAADQRQAQLDAFAMALSKKRQQAVDARRQSGIELVWQQDEEHYEGIDDANRGEQVTLKPRNQTGGASVVEEASAEGSTIFMPITRPYVDFSAGRAADMLLPTDDPNWDLKEPPMPDVIGAMTSDKPLAPPPGVQLVPGAPTTIGQAATQMVAEAKTKVGKAKKRVEDWLEVGQYSAEQRKVLRDAAKVGVGILKGPFPTKRMARVIARGQDGSITMQVQNKTAPTSKRISYWNFFPDPACGEDIHKGNYVWERDSITARQLRDLLGTKDADGVPMYLEDTIEQILAEGPQRKFEGESEYSTPDAENFEIWYYHGVATAEDLLAAGVDAKPGEVLPVIITMVNDRVIKAALSTLDSGEFPYDVMVWQEREGHWAGIGVSRQMRACQRIVNGGIRNLMDNAGLSAGPMYVMMKGVLKPLGRGAKYGIHPRKMWELDPDSNIDDVRKAFAAIELPMLGDELLNIINFGLKMAEDVTGMPMLMQGQQGQASDTVGGMTILNNNSNTPLRSIAKLFDDKITVPHLLRYYEWLLLYGPSEDEKGEYVVVARGSSALFERDAQNQAILQMASIVKDPDFRIDPQKWFKEYLRAQRLDPDRFTYSDAEWKLKQQQMAQQPQPVDPRIQTAQIGAQARVQVANIQAGVQQQRIQSDTDRDNVFAQNEAARTQADAQAQESELQLKRDLAMLQYATQRQLSLDQVKAELANTGMKLQVQKQLSAMSTAADLHKHHNPSPQALTPPTEPAGRAPAGEAWQA